MPINLDGLIFGQIMGDNSGPSTLPGTPGPLDTDLDGTASQEDEFVSVTNTNTTPLDISGWQIWSDSTGGGSPTNPIDGLYHTFPPGTVLQPGETLWIVNEVTGDRAYAQEASEGSGNGGAPNLLSEGNSGPQNESIALVDPVSGDYIIFNMSTSPSAIPGFAGFPGTNQIGVIDGHAVTADMAAGESYQYDAATDTYIYDTAFIPCFASDARIATPHGEIAVEDLKEGDLVLTADHGPQPVLWHGTTTLDFRNGEFADQRPVEFKPGSLGPALPSVPLVVSPQHRFVVVTANGEEMLAPAIGLSDRSQVRVKKGVRQVTYHHIVLPQHAVIFANGVPTESFYPGDQSLSRLPVRDKLALLAHFPRSSPAPAKARPFLSVSETRNAREASLRPLMAVNRSRKWDETDRRATA